MRGFSLVALTLLTAGMAMPARAQKPSTPKQPGTRAAPTVDSQGKYVTWGWLRMNAPTVVKQVYSMNQPALLAGFGSAQFTSSFASVASQLKPPKSAGKGKPEFFAAPLATYTNAFANSTPCDLDPYSLDLGSRFQGHPSMDRIKIVPMVDGKVSVSLEKHGGAFSIQRIAALTGELVPGTKDPKASSMAQYSPFTVDATTGQEVVVMIQFESSGATPKGEVDDVLDVNVGGKVAKVPLKATNLGVPSDIVASLVHRRLDVDMLPGVGVDELLTLTNPGKLPVKVDLSSKVPDGVRVFYSSGPASFQVAAGKSVKVELRVAIEVGKFKSTDKATQYTLNIHAGDKQIPIDQSIQFFWSIQVWHNHNPNPNYLKDGNGNPMQNADGLYQQLPDWDCAFVLWADGTYLMDGNIEPAEGGFAILCFDYGVREIRMKVDVGPDLASDPYATVHQSQSGKRPEWSAPLMLLGKFWTNMDSFSPMPP